MAHIIPYASSTLFRAEPNNYTLPPSNAFVHVYTLSTSNQPQPQKSPITQQTN